MRSSRGSLGFWVPAGLGVLLTACAGSPWMWRKEGATALRRDQDERECRREAEESVPDDSGYVENPEVRVREVEWRRARAFEGCMKSRGYRWVESPGEEPR